MNDKKVIIPVKLKIPDKNNTSKQREHGCVI